MRNGQIPLSVSMNYKLETLDLRIIKDFHKVIFCATFIILNANISKCCSCFQDEHYEIVYIISLLEHLKLLQQVRPAVAASWLRACLSNLGLRLQFGIFAGGSIGNNLFLHDFFF